MNNTMSRYTSTNNINYESMIRKNMQNEKLKELEKIYLPRMESRMAKKSKPKREVSTSKITNNKDK